jgi:serine/threonine protein kinase
MSQILDCGEASVRNRGASSNADISDGGDLSLSRSPASPSGSLDTLLMREIVSRKGQRRWPKLKNLYTIGEKLGEGGWGKVYKAVEKIRPEQANIVDDVVVIDRPVVQTQSHTSEEEEGRENDKKQEEEKEQQKEKEEEKDEGEQNVQIASSSSSSSSSSSPLITSTSPYVDGDVVALKIIEKNLIDWKMLSREIHILSKLSHPNILRFKNVVMTRGEVVIVTEYLGGGELYEKLLEVESYSERDAWLVIKQMLSALAYAHERGVVHRDIKVCALSLASA